MSGLHVHFLHKQDSIKGTASKRCRNNTSHGGLLKQMRVCRNWWKSIKPLHVKKTKSTNKHKKRRPKHWLALVSALAHFVVKVHLDLQDELQLLVGAERGQRAVDLLAGVHGLPVVLIPQVHFVAAGRLLVVVPAAGAFLCGSGGETLELRVWCRDNSHMNQVNGRATLTVEAHWLGHTYDVLHLVVSVGKTKPLLLCS